MDFPTAFHLLAVRSIGTKIGTYSVSPEEYNVGFGAIASVGPFPEPLVWLPDTECAPDLQLFL
jgi:hypothetical protein